MGAGSAVWLVETSQHGSATEPSPMHAQETPELGNQTGCVFETTQRYQISRKLVTSFSKANERRAVTGQCSTGYNQSRRPALGRIFWKVIFVEISCESIGVGSKELNHQLMSSITISPALQSSLLALIQMEKIQGWENKCYKMAGCVIDLMIFSELLLRRRQPVE